MRPTDETIRRRPRIIKAPCLRCGRPTAVSRATYLFSISHMTNVGPFHWRCAELFSVEEEDALWAKVDAVGLEAAGVVLP